MRLPQQASRAASLSARWGHRRPTRREPQRLSEQALYEYWRRVRGEAAIAADARLRDLRHSHASHAIMNGESLHMAGRLLGHRRASTTSRYAHLDDVTLSEAAERVALHVVLKLRKVEYKRVSE